MEKKKKVKILKNDRSRKNKLKEKVERKIGVYTIEMTPSLVPFSGLVYELSVFHEDFSSKRTFIVSSKMFERLNKILKEEQFKQILLFMKANESNINSALEKLRVKEWSSI